MRVSKRWWLGLGVVLCLFLFAAFLFSRSDFLLTRGKQVVEEGLEKQFGQKIKVGHIRAGLFSASLELDGLSTLPLSTDTAALSDLTLHISKVILRFSPWSALAGSLRIREILIESPSVSMTPQRLRDLVLFFKNRRHDPQHSMEIDALRVTDGTFSYQEERGALSLSGIDLTIHPDKKMRHFEVHASSHSGTFVIGKDERSSDRYPIFLRTDGVIHPNEIEMLDINLVAELPIERLYPLKWQGEEVSGNALLEGRLRGSFQNPTLTGAVSLTQISLGSQPIGAVSGNISYKDKKLEWMSVSGNLLSGTIQGNGKIEPLGYALTLQYQGVQVGSGRIIPLPQVIHPSTLQDIAFSGTVSLSGKGQHLKVAEGEVEAKRGNAAIGPRNKFLEMPLNKPSRLLTQIQEASVSWGWGDTRLTLQGGTIRFLGGTAHFSGGWRQTEGVHIETIMDSEEIQAITESVGIPLTGKVHLVGKLSGKEPRVEGNFTIAHATYREHPIGGGSSQFSYQNRQIVFSDGVITSIGKGLPIGQVEGDFHLADAVGTERAMPQPKFKFRTRFHDVDPQSVLAIFVKKEIPFHTTVEGELTLQGTPEQFSVEGPLAMGAGSLYGENFREGKLNLTVTQNAILLQNVLLEKGNGKIEGTGEIRYHEGMKIALKADSVDVTEIDFLKAHIPNLHGTTTAEAKIDGDFDHPVLTMTGSIQSLSRGETTQNNLLPQPFVPSPNFHLQGEVVLQRPYPFSFKSQWSDVPLTSQASQASQAAQFSLHLSSEISGSGEFDQIKQSTISGHFSLASLQYVDATLMTGPGSIEMKGGRLAIKWEIGATSQLAGDIGLTTPYPFNLKGDFKDFNLALISNDPFKVSTAKWFAEWSGRLKGKGDLVSLNQLEGDALFDKLSGQIQGYPIQNEGAVVVSVRHGALRFEQAQLVGADTAIHLFGGLTPLKRWDLFVKGEAGLDMIRLFTKQVSSAHGAVSVNLSVSDRWDHPNVQGEVSLQNGVVRLFSLSETIQIHSLSAILNEQSVIVQEVDGKIGRGSFHLDGKLDLVGFKPKHFSFLANFHDLQIYYPTETPALLEGELLYQGEIEHPTLRGEIHLKKWVYYKPVEWQPLLLKWRDKKKEELFSEIPFIGDTKINLHLYGNEKIKIDNNVADIPLSVDWIIQGTLDKPSIIGRVEAVRGVVYFRNTAFKLQTASADFLNQSQIAPIFDIRAQTHVENGETDYAIDLGITGTLSQFILTLTSSPTLSDTDILALLTIGRTTTQTTDPLGGNAGGAATSMVVTELLGESVERLSGLNRVQIDPYSEGTRYTVEKKLMENRLLVTYTYSTNPSEQALIRMVYEFNNNLFLIGERNEKGHIGGTFRFRFERR